MSGVNINSILLVAFGLVAGGASLVAQTFYWQNDAQGLFSKGWESIKEIFRRILNTLMVWDTANAEYNNYTFVRMSVTFGILVCFFLVVFATFDQVNSFWIYFILYVLLALVLFPVAGIALRMIMNLFKKPPPE